MEIVDSPLNFNILLGQSWIYSMYVVVSSLFRVIKFPFQGKIITVDQLALFNTDGRVGNVPFVGRLPPIVKILELVFSKTPYWVHFRARPH